MILYESNYFMNIANKSLLNVEFKRFGIQT